MERINTVIIGGGASGLFCACALKGEYAISERNDRLGKKLSATGNGQGNLTNENVCPSAYYSLTPDGGKIEKIINGAGKSAMLEFFTRRGFMLSSDERGRYYPLSRQASAVTDLLRYEVGGKAKRIYTGALVSSVKREKGEFIVEFNRDGKTEKLACKNLVVATGGKSAKNFGSDGNGYNLAKSFGHTVTEIYPSLVQLKTETEPIKGLKGIKTKVKITAKIGGRVVATDYGDLIFTDFGVSGDTIFRLSAKITHQLNQKTELIVDFCPDESEESLIDAITVKKRNVFVPPTEILCGILPNKIGRLILSKTSNTQQVAKLIKNYPLTVTGNLGFDNAQVSKGGIPLDQVDFDLQSKKADNLFFTGEILDCDGDCGGFNLQWAFSCAMAVANKINNG